MILLNVDHRLEAGFNPLDVHYCLFLAKAYGWRAAGSLRHPQLPAVDHWPGSYYPNGVRWRADDCAGLAAALTRAWAPAWTWRNALRDRDRARTVVEPSGVQLHWDFNSEFDRMPYTAESPFGEVQTMAALVRLRALLALGGALHVVGQPAEAHPGHLDLVVRGTPLHLAVRMVTGVQLDDQVLGAGETVTLDAPFASELVAMRQATWIETPVTQKGAA